MNLPLEFIQSNIECGGFDEDVESKRMASVCLLEKIVGSLNEYHLEALYIANNYQYELEERDVEALLENLHSLSEKGSAVEASKARIALSALDKKEGLSGYMAEFLVEWGKESGISDNDIVDCLRQSVER